MTSKPSLKSTLGFALISVCCYWLISFNSYFIFLLPGYYIGLWQMTKAYPFYGGLLNGLLISAVHLRFFYNIFQVGSLGLWLVLTFWTVLFCILGYFIQKKLKNAFAITTICTLHFFIEIIYCEVYPLKFTWLNTGFFTFKNPQLYGIGLLGIYGFSYLFFYTSVAAWESKKRQVTLPLLAILLILPQLFTPSSVHNSNGPIISGIQLEFPDKDEVLKGLQKTYKKHPETDIFLLSEYTFLDEVPQEIKDWCRKNKKYLICGSKKYINKKEDTYFNSATVINSNGEEKFNQAKSVPIQFFNDGSPAESQHLWESPWGKMGLAICYDLSYAFVIDELVRQGAQALIIPTMDAIHWGENQHHLHERVGPTKAVEYGVPIFKVSSSGISQFISGKGKILASAPFPGQGETLSARLPIGKPGSLPQDRNLILLPLLIFLLTILLQKAGLIQFKNEAI
ncbi:MAG: carbon-nitrogen hydrolase family protein [Lentisphaerales bacterium]|nr:carbon-nitrogen hydrolase family protein [Lentisphaerales bacterium]